MRRSTRQNEVELPTDSLHATIDIQHKAALYPYKYICLPYLHTSPTSIHVSPIHPYIYLSISISVSPSKVLEWLLSRTPVYLRRKGRGSCPILPATGDRTWPWQHPAVASQNKVVRVCPNSIQCAASNRTWPWHHLAVESQNKVSECVTTAYNVQYVIVLDLDSIMQSTATTTG